MPQQGRLGDKALCPADSHGCPACPHTALGPAVTGSANVEVNGMPALRVGDVGIHAACCANNEWTAVTGAASVLINGRPAHRVDDRTQHCGGVGSLIQGSENVRVGDAIGTISKIEKRSHKQVTLKTNKLRMLNILIKEKCVSKLPIENAHITLMRSGKIIREGYTNKENGAIRFNYIKPGFRYSITIAHKDFFSRRVELNLRVNNEQPLKNRQYFLTPRELPNQPTPLWKIPNEFPPSLIENRSGREPRILVIGDSLIYGLYNATITDPCAGPSFRLANYLACKFGYQTTVAAQPGGGLSHFMKNGLIGQFGDKSAKTLAEYLANHRTQLTLLAVGSNDARMLSSKVGPEERAYRVSNFRRSLQEAIRIIKAHGSKVILFTIADHWIRADSKYVKEVNLEVMANWHANSSIASVVNWYEESKGKDWFEPCEIVNKGQPNETTGPNIHLNSAGSNAYITLITNKVREALSQPT